MSYLRLNPRIWCVAAAAAFLIPASALAQATQAASPGGSQAPDADWRAYQVKLSPNAMLQAMRDLKPGEQLLVRDKWARETDAASLDYYRGHPTDPRRWEAANRFIHMVPKFVTAVKPEYDGKPSADAMIVDEAARMEYDKTRLVLKAAMDQATDIPDTIPQAVEAGVLTGEFMSLNNHGTRAEYEAIKARIQGHAAKYRDVPAVAKLVGDFIQDAIESHIAPDREIWEWFDGSPNPSVAKTVKAKLDTYSVFKKPIEVSFTAVDGRKVDFKDLRGKVVLLDFWATWCGPCVAELPNVISNYKKYHDKGFEVIGIALENTHASPGDVAEVSRQKMDAAIKVLNAFTAKRDMPWPQYCDGKDFAGDFVRRYGVTAIPQAFLLDQNGNVASMHARGEELEKDIRRLLSL